MHTQPKEIEVNSYPNIHPGSAAIAVTAVSTPVAWLTQAIPLLQALSLLVSIASGIIAIYFFLKKQNIGGK